MSTFKDKVVRAVQMIPKGMVASYGQIALYVGAPKAAREVGWILNGTESEDIDLPWWRVVSNKGYISIRGNMSADKNLQKKLLEAENIEILEDFTFDIEKYRWKITDKEQKILRENI